MAGPVLITDHDRVVINLDYEIFFKCYHRSVMWYLIHVGTNLSGNHRDVSGVGSPSADDVVLHVINETGAVGPCLTDEGRTQLNPPSFPFVLKEEILVITLMSRTTIGDVIRTGGHGEGFH